ncbi:hypothetical protein ZWY2020_009637 [Hordeum vulgare]|nr:hypothetical protein ZWY2020_009637 [Hordeum vulgare]
MVWAKVRLPMAGGVRPGRVGAHASGRATGAAGGFRGRARATHPARHDFCASPAGLRSNQGRSSPLDGTPRSRRRRRLSCGAAAPPPKASVPKLRQTARLSRWTPVTGRAPHGRRSSDAGYGGRDGADRLDDAISMNRWVENNQDCVFFFEDFSDNDTFVLGIQTDWQLQQMIQYGNRGLLASDSKFGTNNLKYPVHSILVFDQQKNAIPVAWIITPNFTHGEIHRWMGALYDRVRTKGPTWQLGGFIIDDPLTDVRTIREVFHAVLISLWRVRHAWHKKLMNKCSDFERRSMMSKRLGEAISSICRGNGDIELFQAFLEDFIDCSGFVDYFKALWFPRLGAWTSVLKTNPLATAEVASAIERYHHLLKLRLMNEADESIYQRVDWLVHKLGTKVHSYYWLDEFSGKDSFSPSRSEWKTGPNPWQEGLQIPDSDIVIEGNCARVVCQKHKEKSHAVLNPSSELALCDCSWSRKGNLCKHAMKSAKVIKLCNRNRI